jgi:hypothetical protein
VKALLKAALKAAAKILGEAAVAKLGKKLEGWK